MRLQGRYSIRYLLPGYHKNDINALVTASPSHSEEFAIKIVPCENPEEVETISTEIAFLKRLSSSYVVSYVNSYLFENELWIVMEYCAGGSMSDLYDIRGCPLEEVYLKAVVAYSVLGLVHLHSQLAIHRVCSYS